MKKKIASAAVTCLFVPGAALAQSSVTISGFLKGGLETLKIGDYTTIGAGGRAVGSGKKSQSGVVDDLSRIIFNVREDLGGGLAAIGQVDMRLGLDTGSLSATRNTHVGLQSKSWGRIFFGRQDLHYMNTASDITRKNAMRADNSSLLTFAGAWSPVSGAAVNGGVAIAGATRTQNVVHYTTPNWGGFTGIVAWSSNPIAAESDIGNPAAQNMRHGHAWNVNPGYAAANWQVGYSFWKSKPDAGLATPTPGPTTAGAANQRGNRLYGYYTFGFGLKAGLAWDRSKLEGNGLTEGVTFSKRTVWSIPLQYSFMSKHQITGHYTWAKNDQASLADGLNTKARMLALGYSYDLSNRTSLALTYARIKNQSNAGYNLYNSASLGLGASGLMAGEDPRMFGTTLRHAF